jgi:DNA primase small subunit
MEDIVLQYTWPRIDAEVSKHRNHLLKAPFCVHPKTGRVCVPVDPTRVEEFDPARVPTVGQLLKEIDEVMLINSEDSPEGTQQVPGKSSVSPKQLTLEGRLLSRVRGGDDNRLSARTNSGRQDVVKPPFLI